MHFYKIGPEPVVLYPTLTFLVEVERFDVLDTVLADIASAECGIVEYVAAYGTIVLHNSIPPPC